jgi:hypothetical protein
MALRDETNVSRVCRIAGIDRFQPVIVYFGAGLKTRHQQRTFLCTDGVARNGFAACDI